VIEHVQSRENRHLGFSPRDIRVVFATAFAISFGAGVVSAGCDGPQIVPTKVVTMAVVPKAFHCTSDNDCPSPGQCVPFTVGGFGVCTSKAIVVTTPPPSGLYTCDATSPCAKGTCEQVFCFEGAFAPCGAGGGGVCNMCIVDECATDGDCAGGVCGAPGVNFNPRIAGSDGRACFSASCRNDSDCTAAAGGVCTFVGGCYPALAAAFMPFQVACVYPGGCLSPADCCGGAVCAANCRVVGGAAVCVKS
jgi:hypothetical protein